MKQLVVAPSFPFSSHTFVTREVASSLHSGDDVWVLAPSTGDAMGEEFCSQVGFPRDRVIYLNYLRCRPFSLDLTRFSRSIAKAAMPEVYGRVLGEQRKTFFARLLRDERLRNIDLIHAHFIGWGYRVAVPLATLMGVPVTVTAHEVELPDLAPADLRYVQENAQVITVVSSEYLKHWVKLTGSEDRLRVVHNGVDLSEFGELHERPELDGRRVRLVSVSRLVPHKRIADGIKAVRRLVDEGIDVEYAVISDGPERPALEALRADLDLTDRVRLCGFLPRKKVVEELLHADILVHPSEAEGFGVAVTEGMAAGLPTVVARSGGVLDIVAHGRSGYLYEPGDLNSLVGHIASLAKNKDMRLAFGRVGREIAEAQFSWEHHMKEMCRAWQDALREPAGRHG